MSKAVEVTNDKLNPPHAAIDSKYRLIIVAAKRSKQLMRGARPRIDMDPQRHKATRIALEEVNQGKIGFEIIQKK
jgi:DNA-directed RNA polymerase omega subunit